MLDIKGVYKIQSEYGVADGAFKDSEVSFDIYMSQCRIFITRHLPDTYSKMDFESKQQHLIKAASEFVQIHQVRVKGYVSVEGILNTELLLEDVCDMITGASIIKEAIEDVDVDEIQINDKNTIFVAKKGVLAPYVDSKGRIQQFATNDEVHILLNKLIDDNRGNIPQFTEGLPLLNAKTFKHQYRVNAVHHVANSSDKPPYNFPITSVVIRKFKETTPTLADLIKHGAINEKMGRFLDKLGRAELKLFCVGPTGSGKTTLLRIIASTIPHDKRIILIQNPTEITFMERDEAGRNNRNVVHWEVHEAGSSGDSDTKISASMENLISNSLRATPEIVIVGEARASSEFFQISRAMRTGHKTFGTFHAEDSMDALERFATELSTVSNTTYTESLRLVADTVDIIISQFKFPDGSRKVMEITEICGSDSNGKPVLNTIFEFELTGETRKSVVSGKVEVVGKFKQKGVLSERMQKMFFKSGISKDEILEFVDKTMVDR